MSWLIYKHTCPNGKVYIGQTCQSASRRWREGKGYEGQVFYNAVLKYGWDNIKHDVLIDNIKTQEECNALEIKYISEYRSYISKYGYNVDLGGYVFSKVHTENFGKHLRKEVYQIDDNLNIVAEFESCSEAAKKMGVTKAPIFRCANKHISNTGRRSVKAAGYYWCWKSEYENWTPPVKKENYSYRAIYQIDIDTLKPIDRFENGLQIERTFNRKVAPNINLLLHNKGNYITVLDSYWCYVDEYYEGWKPKRTVLDNKNHLRQYEVYCIDKKTLKIVKKFANLSEANEWLGVKRDDSAIGRAISGKVISSRGYYWCKVDEYYEGWKPRRNRVIRAVKYNETSQK